jgi:hypothetical protein
LLAHRTRIPDILDWGLISDFLNDPEATITTDKLRAYVRGRDPLFAPGSSYQYADTNYILPRMRR